MQHFDSKTRIVSGASRKVHNNASVEKFIPNLFIIGAPKCGTTSLAQLLARNNAIFLPLMKESHFFDNDQRFNEGDVYLRALYKKGINKKYCCDASPTYMARHEKVIPRMTNLISNLHAVRFIIILRDPVARFCSHVAHNRLRLTESRHLNEVARFEIEKLGEGANVEELEYIMPGFYGQQLERWLHYFDRHQFCILFSTDLIVSSKLVCSRLQHFLGVPRFSSTQTEQRNKSGMPRSELAAKLLTGQSKVRRWLKPLLSVNTRSRLSLALTEMNTKRAQIDADLSDNMRMALNSAYSSDKGKLTELLGEPLPW